MIGISGIAPLAPTSALFDQEIITDGTTTLYSFPLTAFADGAVIKLIVSFTSSGTQHCSYEVNIHKQNNIGLTITPVSSRTYNSMAINFTASGYTGVDMTLSSAVVGVLKISPILMNL